MMMNANVGMKMVPPWHRTASVMLPITSIGFGFFLFKFSCIYTFGLIGLQTETVSDTLKACDKTLDRSEKWICRHLRTEITGGIMGIIFGLIQMGIGVAMLITKDKPELCNVWAVAKSILLPFVLTSGALALHVYEIFPSCESPQSGQTFPRLLQEAVGKQYGNNRPRERCELPETVDNGKRVCAYIIGCSQIKTKDINGIIISFGIIAVLDAIFLFACAVIMAVIYQDPPSLPGGNYRPGYPGALQPTASNPQGWPTQSQQQLMSPSQAAVYNQNPQQYYGGVQNPQMYPYQNQPMPLYQNQPMPAYQNQPQYTGQTQQAPPSNSAG